MTKEEKGREEKEVVSLHRYYRRWTQQQLGNEFNEMHVGMELRRNSISQILQEFVKIIQLRDDLKEEKRI